MKIMFCTSSMGKGGAERVISILANKLVNDNEVSILINTNKNISYKLDEKVKIIALDNKYYKNTLIRNIYRIRQTRKNLLKEKPDIVLSFLPMPSFRIIIANRKLRIPIVISDRNDPKQEYASRLTNFLMNWLYPKADGFVFQTNKQKEYFDKKIQEKSTVIFNPIKDEFLNAKNIKIADKENVVINVGRLVEQKNQKMLIDAFAKFSKRYPEYRLKIYGEGPLKDNLKKHIDDLKMNNKIFLCGITDNIKSELEKSKIFVLSSYYEGMPNALIEAMAVGCAVISTDCPCGGPCELIENGVNGVLIAVNNEIELVNSLEDLAQDENKLKVFSENAKNIAELLKTENIVKQWSAYISKVLKERNFNE